MTTTETINIVKVLLKHIGEDPDQDKALAQGALVILDSAKDNKPKVIKMENSAAKPSPKKRKPFDAGKMKALLDGGWPVAKIADEMGCSVATIYDHMKKEGLAVGKQ